MAKSRRRGFAELWSGSRIASSDLTMPPPPDTRPRFPYTLPDGREIRVTLDHGDVPRGTIDYELVTGDPLWTRAKTRPGTQRRFVVARLRVDRLGAARVTKTLGHALNGDELLAHLAAAGMPAALAESIVEECAGALRQILETARW